MTNARKTKQTNTRVLLMYWADTSCQYSSSNVGIDFFKKAIPTFHVVRIEVAVIAVKHTVPKSPTVYR